MATTDDSTPRKSTEGAHGAAVSDDSTDLAKFGYRQELSRSLGGFSAFAAGFSLISVLTGVYQLFGFGFAFAGPTVWWTWLGVLVGMFLVALCFAELAGQFPLAGSVYQGSKQISSQFISCMSGWLIIALSIVNVAAVAVGWQVILPQVWSGFQMVGGESDIGSYLTPGGAQNAIILGIMMVVLSTVINMSGVRIMARVNNIGVACELIGVVALIILLAFHVQRGPAVVTESLGAGQDHSWGLVGALLIGGLMSFYDLQGYDVAATLAEETHDPRRKAPPAILRALGVAGVMGLLVIGLTLMAVEDLHDENIGLLGLPYVVKQTFGDTIGDLLLIDAAISIFVCALAIQTWGIRMLFSMGRDNRLPFGAQIAKVHGRHKVPLVPAAIIGVASIAVLVLNLGNTSAFVALTSVTIVGFYSAYLCVVGPLLVRRFKGEWPRRNHGDYFSLGRWGKPVNVAAVAFLMFGCINAAWPRPEVYNAVGDPHWYYRWIAFLFMGLVIGVGSAYYFAAHKGRSREILAEHSSETLDRHRSE